TAPYFLSDSSSSLSGYGFGTVTPNSSRSVTTFADGLAPRARDLSVNAMIRSARSWRYGHSFRGRCFAIQRSRPRRLQRREFSSCLTYLLGLPCPTRIDRSRQGSQTG